jgi:hypothetical protein
MLENFLSTFCLETNPSTDQDVAKNSRRPEASGSMRNNHYVQDFLCRFRLEFLAPPFVSRQKVEEKSSIPVRNSTLKSLFLNRILSIISAQPLKKIKPAMMK